MSEEYELLLSIAVGLTCLGASIVCIGCKIKLMGVQEFRAPLLSLLVTVPLSVVAGALFGLTLFIAAAACIAFCIIQAMLYAESREE